MDGKGTSFGHTTPFKSRYFSNNNINSNNNNNSNYLNYYYQIKHLTDGDLSVGYTF